MTRRILTALFALILCFGLAVSASAESPAEFLYDGADLLTDSEEAALVQKLSQVSRDNDAQIVIWTLSFTEGGDADSYVDYLYDSMGFGYGENRDGVLLLVSMDLRQYRILSNGYPGRAISAYEIDAIGDAIVDDLSNGNYQAAFSEFADQCAYYLDGYRNGFPFPFGQNLLISLVIGLVIGLIVALVLKGQLRSVRSQESAHVYRKPGSMKVNIQRDIFLYRNVVRTKKETKSSSGSGSGGGSRSRGGGSF